MTRTGGRNRQPPRDHRARIKLKKNKNISPSSRQWLSRQLNDPYVSRAVALGLRSRAAFKLSEMDDIHGFLRPGARVADLGAAPGGWSLVAARRVGADTDQPSAGQVAAIDLQPMDPIPGVTVLHLDFCHPDAVPALKNALRDGQAEVVLSDMAAPATGHRQTDHLRIMELCQAALVFARQILTPGGVFLCKVLQGGTQNTLLAGMKRDFARVRHIKPQASRADSAELYVLATDFRPE